jgi:hypothetical protein
VHIAASNVSEHVRFKNIAVFIWMIASVHPGCLEAVQWLARNLGAANVSIEVVSIP